MRLYVEVEPPFQCTLLIPDLNLLCAAYKHFQEQNLVLLILDLITKYIFPQIIQVLLILPPCQWGLLFPVILVLYAMETHPALQYLRFLIRDGLSNTFFLHTKQLKKYRSLILMPYTFLSLLQQIDMLLENLIFLEQL